MSRTTEQQTLDSAQKRLRCVSNVEIFTSFFAEFAREWKAALLDFASKMEQQQSGPRLKDWRSLFLQSESGLRLLHVLQERREKRVAEPEIPIKQEQKGSPEVSQFCDDPSSSIYKQMRTKFGRLGALGRAHLVNLESFTHEICNQTDLPTFTKPCFTMKNQVKHAKLLEFTKRMEQSSRFLSLDSTLITPSTALMHDLELFMHIDASRHQIGLPFDRLTTHLQLICAQRRYQIVCRIFELFRSSATSKSTFDHNQFPYLVTRTVDLEDKLQKLLASTQASHDDCNPNDDIQFGVYLDRYFDEKILLTQIEAFGANLDHPASNESGLVKTSNLEATYLSLHDFAIELLEEALESEGPDVASQMSTFDLFDAESSQVRPNLYHDTLLQNEVDLMRVNDATYHKERLKRFCSNYSKFTTIQDSESTNSGVKGSWNEQKTKHVSGENISQTKLYNYYLLKFLYCRELRQKLMRLLNYLHFLAYRCQFRQKQAKICKSLEFWEQSRDQANENATRSQLEMPWRAISTSEGENFQASSIRIVGLRSQNPMQETGGAAKNEIIFSRTLEMLDIIVNQLSSAASKVIKAGEIHQMEAIGHEANNPSQEDTKRLAIDRLGVLCELLEMEVEYLNGKAKYLVALGIDTIAYQMSSSHCLLMVECIQQRPQILEALNEVQWGTMHHEPSNASLRTLREGYNREITYLALFARLIEGITAYTKEEQKSLCVGSHNGHCDQDPEVAMFLVRELCRNDIMSRLHTSMRHMMRVAQEQWSDILPYPLKCFYSLSMRQALLEEALVDWEAIKRQTAYSCVTLECKVDELFTTKKGYNVNISQAIIYESVFGRMNPGDIKLEDIIKRLPAIIRWSQWHRAMSSIMYTRALLEKHDTSEFIREISKKLQVQILERTEVEASFVPLATCALFSHEQKDDHVQPSQSTTVSLLLGSDIVNMSITHFLGWIGAHSAPSFHESLYQIMQLEQVWNVFLTRCILYHNCLAGDFVDDVASAYCTDFLDISTIGQNEFKAKATAFMERARREHREKVKPFLAPIARYKDRLVQQASLIVNNLRTSHKGSEGAEFWQEILGRMVRGTIETMEKALKIPQHLLNVHNCLWLMQGIPPEHTFIAGKLDGRMRKCAFSYSKYRTDTALTKALCSVRIDFVPPSRCALEMERIKYQQVEESKVSIQNGLLHVPTFTELLDSLQLSHYFTITLGSDEVQPHQEALVQNFDTMLNIYQNFKLCMELCHLRCRLCFEPAVKSWNVDARYRSDQVNATRIADECELYGSLHDAIRLLHENAFKDCSQASLFLAPISDEIIAVRASKDQTPAGDTQTDSLDAFWRPYALQLRDKDRVLASLVDWKDIMYLRIQTLLSVLELRLALSSCTGKKLHEKLHQLSMRIQQKRTRIIITSKSMSDDRHRFEHFIKLLKRWQSFQPQYFWGLDAFLTNVLKNSTVQRSSHLDQKDFLQSITSWLQSLVRAAKIKGSSSQKMERSGVAIAGKLQQVIDQNEAGMDGSIIGGLRSLHPDVKAFLYPIRVVFNDSTISKSPQNNDELEDDGQIIHVPLHRILLTKQTEVLETHEAVCSIDNDIIVLQKHYEQFLIIKKDLIFEALHKEPQLIPLKSRDEKDVSFMWGLYPEQMGALCTAGLPSEEVKLTLNLHFEKLRLSLTRSNENILSSIQSQYNQKLNGQALEIAALHSHLKELVESIGIRERVFASAKVCQHRFKMIQMEADLVQLRGKLEVEQTRFKIATLSQSERETAMNRVRKAEAQYRAQSVPMEIDFDETLQAKRAENVLSTRSGHLSVPAKVSLLQSVRSHEEETRTISSLRGEVKQLKEIISDLRVHSTVQKERHTQLEFQFQHSKELYESKLHASEADHKHLRHGLQQLQQELISQKQIWAKSEAQLDRYRLEREQQGKVRREQRMRNIFAAYLQRRTETSKREMPIIKAEAFNKQHKKDVDKSLIHSAGSRKVDDGDLEQLGELKELSKENIVFHYQNQIKRLQLQLNKEIEMKRKVAAQAADLKTQLSSVHRLSPTLINENQIPPVCVDQAQSCYNNETLRDEIPQTTLFKRAYHRPATSDGRSVIGNSTLPVNRNRSRSAQSHRKFVTLKRPETELGAVRGNPSAFAIREPLRYR
uniref:AlNc14C100G6000 protein n=1 Tax=Albugo laibachii Nc14 TaxID=890382 RepID=F0WHD7_9STRA|nr:AlNc14C100G6000 [Albugo laibachii Nc14]|eukprot:CCA20656.1 AlNc14C100G6000 [Albugo laibachii Nc14]